MPLKDTASKSAPPHVDPAVHEPGAPSHDKRQADSRAGDAAVQRLVTSDALAKYPEFRKQMETLTAGSRRDLQRWHDDYGVTGHVVDAVASAQETGAAWYDWIRHAKPTHKAGWNAPPPVDMWNAVDQAIAAADAAYAAGDATLLGVREHAVGAAFAACNRRFSAYLDHDLAGAETAVNGVETSVVLGGTTVGFLAAGPAGAAAGAGLGRAAVEVQEQRSTGKPLDWKDIGLRSAEDAVSTLAFALVAGPLGEKVFMPLLTKTIGPMLTEAVGAMSAQAINRFFAQFVSGVGSGAFMSALELTVQRMHGGQRFTATEFAGEVLGQMLKAGVVQLVLDAADLGMAELPGADARSLSSHVMPKGGVHHLNGGQLATVPSAQTDEAHDPKRPI